MIIIKKLSIFRVLKRIDMDLSSKVENLKDSMKQALHLPEGRHYSLMRYYTKFLAQVNSIR